MGTQAPSLVREVLLQGRRGANGKAHLALPHWSQWQQLVAVDLSLLSFLPGSGAALGCSGLRTWWRRPRRQWARQEFQQATLELPEQCCRVAVQVSQRLEQHHSVAKPHMSFSWGSAARQGAPATEGSRCRGYTMHFQKGILHGSHHLPSEGLGVKHLLCSWLPWSLTNLRYVSPQPAAERIPPRDPGRGYVCLFLRQLS